MRAVVTAKLTISLGERLMDFALGVKSVVVGGEWVLLGVTGGLVSEVTEIF